jgi:LysM repeat protein
VFGQDDPMTRTCVRRRRLTIAGLSVVLGVVVSSPVAGALGRHGASGPERGRAAQVYVVRAGDTVWSIAEHVVTGDPRPLVDAISRRNHLGRSVIVPGQSLVIPPVG